ncbi:MAG TPA: hypothetical protein VFP15_10815 [Gemmatimonadaceae bacterium]|nr:hypothetical protein [Gemmatimonadaceae bacterium]
MSEAPEKMGSPPPASKLPEYDLAGRQLVWELLQELMRAKDPVLSMIPRQPVDHVKMEASPPEASTVGVSPAPAPIATTFADKFDTILNMDFEGFAEMMDDAANQSLEIYMPQFFKQMEEVTRRGGTTVDAKGKPFTIDLYLDALEAMEIDFSDDGTPNIPKLVAGPELAEKISALKFTAEQLARQERILTEKKKVFDARRRVRKLD